MLGMLRELSQVLAGGTEHGYDGSFCAGSGDGSGDGHLRGPGGGRAQGEGSGDFENPYFDEVTTLPGVADRDQWAPQMLGVRTDASGVARMFSRDSFTSHYAWAIPAPATISWLVEAIDGRPVVELGAGLGYWAWQLSQQGVAVRAYDLTPRPGGAPTALPDGAPTEPWPMREGDTAAGHPGWFEVQPGSVEVLQERWTREAVLLLCWPPCNAMPAQAVADFGGDTVVHVGEGRGGCTGAADLYDQFASWPSVRQGPLMRWHLINDQLEVRRR